MDGEEPEARRLLGNDQMKRYVVISQMTPRGPEYRIYDRVNEATVEGGFETQKWAESIAEVMEEENNEQNKIRFRDSKVDSRQSTE